MTRDAGRELDALIAEKVMGQRVQPASVLCAGDPWDRGDFYVNKPDAVEPRWGHMLALPCYSTEIAAAWEVVEKISGSGEVGRQVGINAFLVRDAWFWRVTLWSGTEAQAETAPLAICLAALQAVQGAPPETPT